MDTYTEKTRDWLEDRYRRASPDGIYIAHQPIYGFRTPYSEPYLGERYVRTLTMLRMLARLSFSSCVDIGAAEGYTAKLVTDLLGVKTTAVDLSEEACARASELFGLDARAADVHSLPFRDNEFDVAICSETLEHVPEFDIAVREVLRVARLAAVISVPREPADTIARNRERGVLHGHIQALDDDSLDWVREELGYDVVVRPIVSPATVALCGIVEGATHGLREPRRANRVRNLAVRVSNAAAKAASRLVGVRSEALLVDADALACRVLRAHRAITFVVIKDPSAWSDRPARRISARQVISFAVPLHRLNASR